MPTDENVIELKNIDPKQAGPEEFVRLLNLLAGALDEISRLEKLQELLGETVDEIYADNDALRRRLAATEDSSIGGAFPKTATALEGFRREVEKLRQVSEQFPGGGNG